MGKIKDIEDIERECAKKDWDGYDGDPVKPSMCLAAKSLFKALSRISGKLTEDMDISPCADGGITFEWRDGKDFILCMEIAEKGSKIIFRGNKMKEK